ncbi:hypothetical protein [Pseudoalteromonas marina]|uniref:Uncharacterized protein n=1 Tax=Pseudoalteromonas marina TaxID=267375 RepID=A0ABT9FAE9_9GAMM|nr:hypothetical protein [Pseudoalteromonas marina]MDP2563761.1 hypothetical protein [Pseudoalteromonas marina]
MRLLILLLALLSVFFVSNAYALINYDDLRSPKTEFTPCAAASFNGAHLPEHKVCSHNDAKMQSCNLLAATVSASSSSEYEWNAGGTCVTENNSIKFIQEGTRIYSDGETLPTTRTFSIRFANLAGEEIESCPPPAAPLYYNPVTLPDGSMRCAKDYDAFDNCPPPSENDMFTGGTASATTQCFANPDGTQCKISTGEDGSYYLPVSYGSSEPQICQDAPYEPVDKTPEPSDKPAPEETDPTPEIEPIDSMNKVNENLDSMNTNQLESSRSNDELLDRIVAEIQIGNQVIGQIRDQPSTHTGLPFQPTSVAGAGNPIGGGTGGGTGEPCTGDDCGEEPADDFSITGARKTGGLNAIFTVEDTALVTAEIEAKKTELTDYIELIKNESSTILDVDPNISGAYTDHKEIIKGVEVDLGIGRFSNFYQMIAPAIILIASITALFIILGGNKE